MANINKTRVLVVDDHYIVALAIASEIRRQPRLDPVGVCHNSRTAEAMALIERPDVVLMDVVMPGKDPFQSCERIINETGGEVRVLFYTGQPREDYLHRCRRSGGSGLACKGTETIEELAAIIEHVASGEEYFSPEWEQRLVELESGGELTPQERLTPQEIAVIHRLAAGQSTRSIAERFGVPVRTVQRAVASARSKFNCETTEQLLWVAAIECIATPTQVVGADAV